MWKKAKSEDDGRAVGNRTRADSLNLAARKDRELPPSPHRETRRTDLGIQDQSQEPQDLTVKEKMGRSSAPRTERAGAGDSLSRTTRRIPHHDCRESRQRTTSRHRGSKQDRYGTPKHRSHPAARTALHALGALTAPIPPDRDRGDMSYSDIQCDLSCETERCRLIKTHVSQFPDR